MGYVEQAALAADSGFQAQVRVAMATAAVSVQGEAVGGNSTSHFGKRQQLSTAVLNLPDAYLTRFCWAVVQNAAITRGNPLAISSSTNASPIVITTGAAHGYSTGAVVEISGHTVNTAANGTFTATVITSTTFSIPAVGVGVGAATGQVVKLPLDSDIQFQVNAVWDDIAGVTILD